MSNRRINIIVMIFIPIIAAVIGAYASAAFSDISSDDPQRKYVDELLKELAASAANSDSKERCRLATTLLSVEPDPKTLPKGSSSITEGFISKRIGTFSGKEILDDGTLFGIIQILSKEIIKLKTAKLTFFDEYVKINYGKLEQVCSPKKV